VILNSYPGPDHHQKLTSSRESPRAHAYRLVNARYRDRELTCS